MARTVDEEILTAARVAVQNCLGVKPEETVLVVTDTEKRDLGEIFRQAAEEVAAEALLLEMKPRQTHGTEPPLVVAEAMRQVDVVLAVTSRSLSHTQARREASVRGVRIASLPGITEETMRRSLNADYQTIARRSRAVAQILTAGHEVHLTSPAGTDLVFSIAGREAEPDEGLYLTRGSFGNLPAGEAFLAPVEGTARGLLVVDGSMGGVGLVREPIRMRVEKGYVLSIEGGEEASRLEQVLAPYGREGKNIAELGVGTNHQARLCGLVLEDEKVLGTVHIALGDNTSFGGRVRVPSHQDGVILKPSLYVDGRPLLLEGRLLIEE